MDQPGSSPEDVWLKTEICMLMSALKKQTVYQQWTQFTGHDLQSIFKIKGAKIKIKRITWIVVPF